MRRKNPWIGLSFKSWALGLEASSVIGLRLMKIAAGGVAAEAESRRMVSEKFAAGLELQSRALRGDLGITPHGAATKSLAHYRRKVRANRKRLSGL